MWADARTRRPAHHERNISGAEEVLALVADHPHRNLRIAPITYEAVRSQLLIATDDLTGAAAGLRRVEAIRERYPANYPSVDHQWFESAAYLTAALDRLDHAATLTHAAEATLGGETSPFVTWTLQRRHGHDPKWRAALDPPPTLDDARALARALARDL